MTRSKANARTKIQKKDKIIIIGTERERESKAEYLNKY